MKPYTKKQRAALSELGNEVWDLATKIEKAIPRDRGTAHQKTDRQVAIEMIRIAAERLYP